MTRRDGIRNGKDEKRNGVDVLKHWNSMKVRLTFEEEVCGGESTRDEYGRPLFSDWQMRASLIDAYKSLKKVEGYLSRQLESTRRIYEEVSITPKQVNVIHNK